MRRQIIDLSEDAGLQDISDLACIDNLADYNTSRGVEGFYQNALITQKREWLDKTPPQEKPSFFRRFFGRVQETDKQQTAFV